LGIPRIPWQREKDFPFYFFVVGFSIGPPPSRQMNDNASDFSDPDNDFTWKIKDTEITYRTKTPKTINQYLLGEVLGKGSYGKVREALDTTNFERVAIKIVKKQMLRKLPGGIEETSVKQEIAIMKNLAHKNVLKMLESFSNEEKGKLYVYILPSTLISYKSKFLC